jgi:hypothetical protein
MKVALLEHEELSRFKQTVITLSETEPHVGRENVIRNVPLVPLNVKHGNCQTLLFASGNVKATSSFCLVHCTNWRMREDMRAHDSPTYIL